MESISAADVQTIFSKLAEVMEKEKARLSELDGLMGDGDLGLTMSRGFKAAAAELSRASGLDPGNMLSRAGMIIAKNAPSTMGTLLATGFMQGGRRVAGKENLYPVDLVDFWDGFIYGIAKRGRAKAGEKTILDALLPAKNAMQQTLEGKNSANNDKPSPADILCQGYQAALEGYEATKSMQARHGRPAYYAEKSIGLPDPGAAVGVLIFEVFSSYAAHHCRHEASIPD
jgi:dihydroxyacetone kinase-like protein